MHSALVASQTMARAGLRFALRVVTYGTQSVTTADEGRTQSALSGSPLWGLARVLAQEQPELFAGLVDLDSHQSVADCAAMLVTEMLSQEFRGEQVAFRKGRRYVARLARYTPNSTQPLTIHSDATYLITGGLGGLGLEMGEWLSQRGARHFVLLGSTRSRRPCRRSYRILAPKGIAVDVEQADVSRADELTRVLDNIRTHRPPLRGILHTAGVLRDGVLAQQTWSNFADVFAPKISGSGICID